MRGASHVSGWLRSLAVLWLAAQVGWSFWRASRRARRLPPPERQAFMAGVYRREGARLRRASLRLAGLIIKVGQFLSTRVDVLPGEFVQELAELQDLVPPAPWPRVRERLAHAYGRWPIPDFAEIEPTAVAAASLAQVHRGWLASPGPGARADAAGARAGAPGARAEAPDAPTEEPDARGESPDGASATRGPMVAVKIWRPGIERLVETDLGTLRTVAGFVARHTAWGRRIDLMALFGEFEATTREELDAFHEADRALEFRRNVSERVGIGAPAVFRELTRPGVLVMEFVEGERIDAPGALARAGLRGRELADRLTHEYLRQLLWDGLFHADPHPGNLILQPDGTLVFVDFGMMGRLGPADREGVALLLRSLFTGDWVGVSEAFVRLDFLRPGADLRQIRDRLRGLLEPALEEALNARRLDVFRILHQVETALYELPVQIPARFAFLGRALGMVMGLATRLNPEEPFEQQFRRAVEDMLLGKGAFATAPRPGGGGEAVERGRRPSGR
ncbi:MAG: AarF/ABC1/UbiB kinase family protein, partial [Clostridia bacterium]|nr:AarF/ABC1/UbiB kinase family protein [Clostridia bacterium]